MPTVKDIAKKCGVSQATVSRAFKSESSMKESTRQLILSTAAEMGYTPNFLASGLKSRKTKTIGIIVPSIDNPFYLDVLKFFNIELKKNGYKMIVNFIQNGLNEESDVLDTMFSLRVDGLIFSPRNAKNEEQIKAHIKTPMLQLFTTQYSDIDSVLIDDVLGTYLLTDLLIKNGHRRILYISGEHRVEGYYKAFSEKGIEIDKSLQYFDWADEKTVEMLIKKHKPTAIMAIARQSENVQRAIRTLALKVPEDISFVAFDDMFWHEIMGITTAAHDLKKVAKTAVKMLLSRIKQNTNTAEKTVLPPIIIERKSVQKIN